MCRQKYRSVCKDAFLNFARQFASVCTIQRTTARPTAQALRRGLLRCASVTAWLPRLSNGLILTRRSYFLRHVFPHPLSEEQLRFLARLFVPQGFVTAYGLDQVLVIHFNAGRHTLHSTANWRLAASRAARRSGTLVACSWRLSLPHTAPRCCG